ncbi:uncharacterized protein (TIGR02453 family) [Gillisia mitskevichiae]|uniref:Uncharacterized protein (TIGR02453 family) n=1 Tax=Gillisia mitskevichiae TaxID=270921 RepID=A0A495PTH6_9FLAO|nr:DUF2461 domain-containing protein [Gillisia mitskevichiae]RKS53070.1 uncharacterized protein (TIGR02453 family) [Gillisia mitskevichiae]
MSYFTDDFSEFFKELTVNNNTEWFHANKERYEKSVKEPFEAFVEKIIEEICILDTDYQITSKECIFRLHRDVRFSKDKSSYKLFSSAAISTNGRKNKSLPGMYIRFSPENITIMGRCYQPSSLQLHKIRAAISADTKGFRFLIDNEDFKEKFGSVRGEINKRIPKEFQSALKNEPLIANKQFYYGTTLPPETITNHNLDSLIMEYWKTMQPLNNFFNKAIL